jgi:hypothetical protein
LDSTAIVTKQQIGGGSGANTYNLVKHHGWKSILFDSGNQNEAINLHKHHFSTDNICDVFAKYSVPIEPDYVRIDVDSTDLWLMDTILAQYRPRLISVEYNSHFPLDSAITVGPNTKQYRGGRLYGASLKALTMVAEKHGYALVAIACSLDAFFVR